MVVMQVWGTQVPASLDLSVARTISSLHPPPVFRAAFLAPARASCTSAEAESGLETAAAAAAAAVVAEHTVGTAAPPTFAGHVPPTRRSGRLRVLRLSSNPTSDLLTVLIHSIGALRQLDSTARDDLLLAAVFGTNWQVPLTAG